MREEALAFSATGAVQREAEADTCELRVRLAALWFFAFLPSFFFSFSFSLSFLRDGGTEEK